MTRLTSRPRLLLGVAFGLAMLLMAETFVLAVTTTKTGGPVRAVKVVTETAVTDISALTFTDVQGMSLSMTVPSGEQALLLITFSGSSYCTDHGSGALAYCHLRVLVDGRNEAVPGQVFFDGARTDGNTSTSYESHSMQFVAGPLSAGQHTIKVQGRVTQGESFFVLQDRTLSVLRSRV